MATAFAQEAADRQVTLEQQHAALQAAVEMAGDTSRTLVLPPDASRSHSCAGSLTRTLHQMLSDADAFDVMPAIGTHFPMTEPEIRRMFGTRIPLEAFKQHRWREDLVRLGSVPADFVHRVSDGVLGDVMPDYDIPVEINRRVTEGGYTALFSVGQVVPHEVVGMANGFKNVLVGTGGQETIHRTHFLGAVYGMERMMGRAETPVRAVLNYAHEHYLADLGIVYVLTVVAPDESGAPVLKGLYVGDDHATFLQAAELSRRVNVTLPDQPVDHVVAYLDPAEFRSTWLGNKAIYRTRMMIADGGELTVIAPGVETFGEDPQIDGLIRRYGYCNSPAVLDAVAGDEALRASLSAAAHLIHGSSEGRFSIIYATDPARLSREEVEGVGYRWRDVGDVFRAHDTVDLKPGPNEGFYFVRSPALGLWAARDRFAA